MTATLTPAQRRARDLADASPGGRLDQALAGNPPPAELAYLTETIGAQEARGMLAFAWFVWDRGHQGAPRFGWLT